MTHSRIFHRVFSYCFTFQNTSICKSCFFFFLTRLLFCCVFIWVCLHRCIYMYGGDGWNKEGMKGRGESGRGERGNEIQKASARCKWQSTRIPSAGFGAGGVLKSCGGEGVPFDQVTPFTLAAPCISPRICWISSGEQEESQCCRHNCGSH